MHVFIKSFNRPYYLDRCIQSVLLNVIDENLSIIVLDDGTHSKYLHKLKTKFPNIEIRLSSFHNEKVKKIQKFLSDGTLIKNMEIPTQFWLSNIMECQDKYFLLLEDDFWLTETINVKHTLDLLKKNNICMLKLFYFGNSKLISGTIKELSLEINEIQPKLAIKNEYFFKKIIIENLFKFRSLLNKMNIISDSIVNYYTIYHVAGAIFSKEYYSHLWKDFTGVVDENKQLIKAVSFFNLKKPRYAVFKKDVVSTSFSSSATNMFADIDFNPFVYNHILNEAWFNDELNAMSGYPKDIDSTDIATILEGKKEELASVSEWIKWVDRFQNQYQQIGFEINNG